MESDPGSMKSEITDPQAKLTCRVVRAANQFIGKQAYGEKLEEHLNARAGDFVYIP
jgi:uncharacterized RmlC-like cupin family protein